MRKADNGWEFISEIIGQERDTYVFSSVISEGRRKGEYKIYYNVKNMNCIKVIRDGREDKETRDVIRKRYDFPLYQGKKWNYRYTLFSERTRRDIDSFAELSVVGFEDIEVPAGKFKTIKVKVKASIIGTSHSGVFYYWYSSDAKARVKTEYDLDVFWRNNEYMKEELISFELK
ncbi:MAG: DUF3108 domain-containing protein [Deltaproteobacteria bacterium]|nr:DUF3108 domain-containing protein [Deltaproteobacteria bacterium]